MKTLRDAWVYKSGKGQIVFFIRHSKQGNPYYNTFPTISKYITSKRKKNHQIKGKRIIPVTFIIQTGPALKDGSIVH